MDYYFINNDILTYDDTTHTYCLNGKEIMSVTTAIKLVNNKYKNISPKVLANAQLRGNALHFDIQMFEEYNVLPTEPSKEFNNYKLLKKAFGFEYLEGEKPVVIKYKDFVLAGRFDLLLKVDGFTTITDIKSTSSYDKKYVALQTELYALGYNQSYPKEEPVTNTAGIHLNGNNKKFDRYLPKVDLEMFFEHLAKALEEKGSE